MRLLIFILFPFFLSAQNKDWQELQGMINDARYSGTGIVTVARNYTIDRPLIIADKGQVSLTIQGYATMSDMGTRSVIRATFKDSAVINIQVGKGVIIRGLNIQGGGTDGTDSRYQVHAGIAIDPFYSGSRSGSTGVRIEDCTFNNLVAGVTTSINGYTQNAESITIQNCRMQAVKYGVIGCQSQEKQNRIINLQAWGPTNCLFVFNRYGAQQPGNWFIDGVNIAGSVDSIIYRASAGWGPLFMKNIFAESIKTIGFWYAGSGDNFSESVINLKLPEIAGSYGENALDGRYLPLQNVNIRYYGRTETPIVFYRIGPISGGSFYVPPVTGQYAWQPAPGYKITQPFQTSTDTVIGNKCVLIIKEKFTGSHVIFLENGNQSFVGQGQIERVSNDTAFIRYISPSIKSLSNYRVGVYNKKQ